MKKQYQVHLHYFGRKRIKSGPCEGLLDFAAHSWQRLNDRPLSLAKAIILADSQSYHAVITPWQLAGKEYDNRKEPAPMWED